MNSPDAPEQSTAAETEADPFGPREIIAKPGSYYRNMRYIMSVIIVSMGLWFAYDGWVAYPADNREIAELKEQQTKLDQTAQPEEYAKVTEKLKELKPHSDMDLILQRGLGFILPPAGIALVVWALYNSRGLITLKGEMLGIPGHRPIHLDEITKLDNLLWDRKGIAYVYYEPAPGTEAKARLDDFLYERKPVDEIYEIILAKFVSFEPKGFEVVSDTAEPENQPENTPAQ